MKPPTQRSGAPPPETRRPRSPATNQTNTESVTDQPIPVLAYAPDKRRSRWLVILEVCPRCRHPHQFYGTPTEPPRVRNRCGRTYHLFPVYGGDSEPSESP